MGLLGLVVDSSFRDEKAGRVVVFPGDRRNRGYRVRSADEELKIRSFLEMFWSAHLSIFLLGSLLASGWSSELAHALGRPAGHLFRTSCVALGIYSVVLGFPYLFFWGSYKKARVGLVSAQDEVLVSGKHARRRTWIAAGVGLIALGILVLVAISVSRAK